MFLAPFVRVPGTAEALLPSWVALKSVFLPLGPIVSCSCFVFLFEPIVVTDHCSNLTAVAVITW